jgi:hypothetical protein
VKMMQSALEQTTGKLLDRLIEQQGKDGPKIKPYSGNRLFLVCLLPCAPALGGLHIRKPCGKCKP